MPISHGELAQMEQAAKNRADNSDRCVCCGAYVPEGRMVCLICEGKLKDAPLNLKPKPRYIDADILLKEIAFYTDRPTKQAMKLIKVFAMKPNPDVVEVVRCKNCIHYNAGFECLKEGYGIERDKDYYCGDGKRRKDNET